VLKALLPDSANSFTFFSSAPVDQQVGVGEQCLVPGYPPRHKRPKYFVVDFSYAKHLPVLHFSQEFVDR
jgi:hypothetical protein